LFNRNRDLLTQIYVTVLKGKYVHYESGAKNYNVKILTNYSFTLGLPWGNNRHDITEILLKVALNAITLGGITTIYFVTLNHTNLEYNIL
jgi:hypothetical protein